MLGDYCCRCYQSRNCCASAIILKRMYQLVERDGLLPFAEKKGGSKSWDAYGR
jgi:hypothetical protein